MNPDSFDFMVNGIDAVTLSKTELDSIIVDRHLAHECGMCRKTTSNTASAFQACSKCHITCYCSKQCQIKHWSTHKPRCKERCATHQLIKKREEEARTLGIVYYDPQTLLDWYAQNAGAVEYAAYHVLEMFKGPDLSLLSTHVAYFNVSLNADSPHEPSTIILNDVTAVPHSGVQTLTGGAATISNFAHAVQAGYMVLLLHDGVAKTSSTEFPKPRQKEFRRPNEHWKIYTMLKANKLLDA